jgi:hypothetical protein
MFSSSATLRRKRRASLCEIGFAISPPQYSLSGLSGWPAGKLLCWRQPLSLAACSQATICQNYKPRQHNPSVRPKRVWLRIGILPLDFIRAFSANQLLEIFQWNLAVFANPFLIAVTQDAGDALVNHLSDLLQLLHAHLV